MQNCLCWGFSHSKNLNKDNCWDFSLCPCNLIHFGRFFFCCLRWLLICIFLIVLCHRWNTSPAFLKLVSHYLMIRFVLKVCSSQHHQFAGMPLVESQCLFTWFYHHIPIAACTRWSWPVEVKVLNFIIWIQVQIHLDNFSTNVSKSCSITLSESTQVFAKKLMYVCI